MPERRTFLSRYLPELRNLQDEITEQEGLSNQIWLRIYRSSVFLLNPLLVLGGTWRFGITIGQGMALALTLVFGFYFGLLAFRVFRAPGLWHIRSVYGEVDGWANMPVTFDVMGNRAEPIQSISEFSAIQGTGANTSLMSLGDYVWSILCFVALWCLHEQPELLAHGDLWFALVGAYGILNIGVWELDRRSVAHRIVHTLSAILAAGTLVAWLLRTQYRWDAWALAAVFVVMFVLWNLAGLRAEARSKALSEAGEISEEGMRDVRRLSILCICTEGIGILAACVALTLWVYFLGAQI